MATREQICAALPILASFARSLDARAFANEECLRAALWATVDKMIDASDDVVMALIRKEAALFFQDAASRAVN